MASIFDWSLTAADNANADADLTWAEGQAPGTVNASARTMMKRVAELLADIGGTVTASGSANALLVSANSAFTTYANGRLVSFKAAEDNTDAATLNVNSIGAKSIRRATEAGDAALIAGSIQAGCIYVAMYNTSLNGGAGGWALINPTTSLAAYVTLTGAETLTNKTLTSPTVTTPTLTLKQSATPTPTAEGDIQWDTDDHVIAVGDSAATQLFVPIPASTAAGDIEYFSGAKAKARVAKGTAAQQLQMNAGATAPEWSSNAYDGETISTFTWSTNVAQVDFTDLAAYSRLEVIFEGVTTAGGQTLLRVSTDNGSNYLTTGYVSGYAETNDFGGSTAGFVVSRDANVSGGIYTLQNFNTNARTVGGGALAYTGNAATAAGGYSSSGVHNALRFCTSSGANITAGKITLKGWRSR